MALEMATPANSLKLTQNTRYEVLITQLKELSGTLITLASRSEIVIDTGDGDPYEFAKTHPKHPL